jgi:hypothetical protein
MSKVPDMMEHLGGVPVASANKYAGWWGQTVYFVDYDNGTVGASGLEMDTPQKNLATAISKANKWDVIYIRPRDPSETGGDTNYITPATAANWEIPTGKYGISLIGTGVGLGMPGRWQTYLRGESTVTSSPTLDIKSCCTTVENLAFHRGASTVGQVRSMFTNAVRYGFGNTISNCLFRYADGAGGFISDAAWYDTVQNSTFLRCRIGIYITSGNSVPTGITITGNDFIGLTTDIDADIFINDADRILIKDCYFNHAVPAHASGSYLRYIYAATAATGLVANCYTGAVDPTVADNMTLNGILYSNIWGDGVGPFVDA